MKLKHHTDIIQFPNLNILLQKNNGKNILNFDELPTVRYFFDNDIKGKQKMIEKLKMRKNVFMWSKFLGDFKLKSQKIKDMNDLVGVCYNLKSPALKHVNEYFTNDPRDIIYV